MGGRVAVIVIGLGAALVANLARAAAPADCEHDRQVISAERGIIFDSPTGLVPGQYYWKLVDAAWCEPEEGGLKINIFYMCLDQNGQQIAGQPCIANYGSTNVTIYTKAPPDWGDFPMTGGNWCPSWPEGGNGPYSAWVDGAPSDKVIGMGLPCNYHESYYLTFQWTQFSSPSRGALEGTVTNTSGGTPVEGVTVSTTPGGYYAVTGIDGRYTIPNVAPATYTVTAEKLGWSTGTQSNVEITAGVTTTVDFQLSSTLASITGVVRDATGQPIAGARITTSPGNYTAVTAQDGTYQLVGIPAQTYAMTAYAPTKNDQTLTGQVLPPNGNITVDFSLTASGTVAHLWDDFNGSYVGSPALEESFKTGIMNQFFWRESGVSRILPPHTGTDSAQGFSVITNNDQFLSYFQTKDPSTGDQWFNIVQYAAAQGWEEIDTSQPIAYLIYVKGANVVSNPDDPNVYWRQQLSVHYPQVNYDNDSIDWNSLNSGTWQMLRVTAPGLQDNLRQWLTFENWYPAYYQSASSGQSWTVWENLMIEYTPVGPGDTTPPGPVVGLAADADPTGVTLSWTNPPDSDTAGARVRFRTDVYPVNAQDGTLLIDKPGSPGQSDATHHNVPADGTTYYYAAFAYDSVPNYSAAATVSITVPIVAPADFDGDGDVDLDDYSLLQRCASGSAPIPQGTGCEVVLLDGDLDVDAGDLAIFIGCMSGANVPADPHCAD